MERTPVRIQVLGGFALAMQGQAVQLPVQAQRLVVLLAVRDRTPRAVAAGLLWGDVLQTRALSNLRNAIWRLNAASAEILEGGRDVVALRPGVSTDLDDARRLGRDVAAGVSPAGMPAALDLLEHDLMPSWDEDWLLMERERQRQVRLHAAEALSRALRAQGRHAEAVQAALDCRAGRAHAGVCPARAHRGAPRGGQRQRGAPAGRRLPRAAGRGARPRPQRNAVRGAARPASFTLAVRSRDEQVEVADGLSVLGQDGLTSSFVAGTR